LKTRGKREKEQMGEEGEGAKVTRDPKARKQVMSAGK